MGIKTVPVRSWFQYPALLQLTHAVGIKTIHCIRASLMYEHYNSRTSWVLKRYNLRCQLLALLQFTHAVGTKTDTIIDVIQGVCLLQFTHAVGTKTGHFRSIVHSADLLQLTHAVGIKTTSS